MPTTENHPLDFYAISNYCNFDVLSILEIKKENT